MPGTSRLAQVLAKRLQSTRFRLIAACAPTLMDR
jgi:hypothetical protein